MPPGSPICSRRAAMFTAVPPVRPLWTTSSPELIPILNLICWSAGSLALRLPASAWTRRLHFNASTALGNSAISPSPAKLERFRREIEKSHGRVFSFAGDGLMAEFPSAVEALKCGLRVQAEAGKRNARLPADQQIRFRIGINSGELVVQRGRTGGTAVNIAARLE